MNKLRDKKLSRRSLLLGSTVAYGSSVFPGLNLQRPLALAAMSDPTPQVLNAAQWQTVDAICARVIPTDEEPGAREAQCVNFIDKALANEDAASADDVLTGLSLLDRLCESSHGLPFVRLDTARQDKVLHALQNDAVQPWSTDSPSAADFFELLRTLTIMGFMADPKYGGNADMMGWKVARYPGPRHHQGGYTPAQMVGEEVIVTLWGEEM